MRIGIDIGGTKVLLLLVDDAGRVAGRIRFATEAERSYERIRDHIFEALGELLAVAAAAGEPVVRIGIASAGQIDRRRGIIIFSPNLDWHSVPLRVHTEACFAVPTTLENDANAAVMAEWMFTVPEPRGDTVGLFIGTGVGGGLVLGGRLYRGFGGVGAEAGHVTMNPQGYQCRCGNRGCLEAYCGGRYLVDRAKKRIDEGYRGAIWHLIGGNVGNLHAGHIEEAALLGDGFCASLWDEAVEYLGSALAGFANLLNPAFIVLGGGVVHGSRTLVEDAKRVMKERAMAASLEGLAVVEAGLGGEAAAIGAAFVDD
jgi:glucokinase